jgi:MFS transporter, DHA3 family, macrolide efflux protein
MAWLQLEAIRDPGSRRLFLGQLISQACDKVMTVGLVWVITLEFSARWVPWFIALSTLPHLALAPFSGRVVSRFGALRVVILTDAARGLLFAGAAAALYLRPLSDDSLLAFLALVSLASSIAGALFNPAILTLPVQIAPKNAREQLTAMIDSCFSFANVLGPLLAVAVYPWAGIPGLLLVNGASYLCATLLSIAIPRPASTPRTADSTRVGTRIRALLRREPVISAMLASFLFMNRARTAHDLSALVRQERLSGRDLGPGSA